MKVNEIGKTTYEGHKKKKKQSIQTTQNHIVNPRLQSLFAAKTNKAGAIRY